MRVTVNGEARDIAANKLVESLYQWTQQGRLPVVLDISSCTLSLKQSGAGLTIENQQRLEKLQILDSVE